MPNKDNGPVHPGIIEQEKKKREDEDRRKREDNQPRVPPRDMPENDPDAQRDWEEEERKKKENPGGVEEYDLK